MSPYKRGACGVKRGDKAPLRVTITHGSIRSLERPSLPEASSEVAGKAPRRRAADVSSGVGNIRAVGISAPLSIVRGAGLAAERGILMRTGEAFQGFRLVKQIVLDKTGTLTEGRPAVREIEALDVSEQELLAIAAAAEASSEHPLAQAVVEAAFERGATPPDVESFEAFPGKGVIARIGNREVLVGNPSFLADRGVDLTRLHAGIEAFEGTGRTVIGVARDGRALGVVALGDTLRSDAVNRRPAKCRPRDDPRHGRQARSAADWSRARRR